MDCECDGADDRPYRCERHRDCREAMQRVLAGIDDLVVVQLWEPVTV